MPRSTALPLHKDVPPTKPVGRLASYSLRVSLLEQCQYRCPYCLPGAVQPYSEKTSWLSAEDYRRLAPLFGKVGVQKVRFTGGEPLLRKDCAHVVHAFRETLPDADLALTTNGQLLDGALDALVEAGLNRLTVHIDTLRDDRYSKLMGPGGTPSFILEQIARAQSALREVKLNVVVQRGENDDELDDFLQLSARSGVEVRFIELMNTGSAGDYVERVFLSGADIVAKLAEGRRVERRQRRHPSDPAALFEAGPAGEAVTFGVIASDTEPFCEACDRLRLTADGRLRGCLYESGGVPLGAALKTGGTDAQLAALIGVGLDDKRSFHPLVAPDRVPFSMADVGG